MICYFFTFPIKILNIHNFRTNAIPNVGVHWGIIGLHPYTFPHLWRCVSHHNTLFWPHGPLHSTFNCEPNVRVVTTLMNSHSKWDGCDIAFTITIIIKQGWFKCMNKGDELYDVPTWRTPKFLDRFNYESKGENNERKKSWGALSSSHHFGGRGACWSSEMGLQRLKKNSIIHRCLYKPNNKLVSA